MYFTFFQLPEIQDKGFISASSWRDSEYVCALSSADRHFGHVVNTGQWHAYDAVHLNAAGTGMEYLGAFADIGLAKRAVELSVGRELRAKVKSAAGIPTRFH